MAREVTENIATMKMIGIEARGDDMKEMINTVRTAAHIESIEVFLGLIFPDHALPLKGGVSVVAVDIAVTKNIVHGLRTGAAPRHLVRDPLEEQEMMKMSELHDRETAIEVVADTIGTDHVCDLGHDRPTEPHARPSSLIPTGRNLQRRM